MSKSKEFKIRVTSKEKSELKRLASLHSETVTNFVLKSVLYNNKIYEEQATPYLKTAHKLNQSGKQLNQLARLANTNGELTPEEVEQVIDLSQQIEKEIRYFLEHEAVFKEIKDGV